MSSIESIASIGLGAEPLISRLGLSSIQAAAVQPGASFADVLGAGMQQVEAKVATANGLVRQFALDDSIPLHQVTFALEEARLTVELAMQVRGRILESYRELMNMQL